MRESLGHKIKWTRVERKVINEKDEAEFIQKMEGICDRKLSIFTAFTTLQLQDIVDGFAEQKKALQQLKDIQKKYKDNAMEQYHNYLYDDASEEYRVNEYDYPIFMSDPSASFEEIEAIFICVMGITISCICTALILLAGSFVYYWIITKKRVTNDGLVHVEHV